MTKKPDSPDLVEESPKTKKIREKLKKHFSVIDQSISSQALRKKSLEIHRWIARNALNRVILRSKSISLFDENKNTAQYSQKVSTIIDRLKK